MDFEPNNYVVHCHKLFIKVLSLYQKMGNISMFSIILYFAKVPSERSCGMSRPVLVQAVTDVTAPEESKDAPRFISEKVRFSFHGIGITLCGILVLLIPELFTAHIKFAGTLIVLSLIWFAWYEWVRCRPAWIRATRSWWLLPFWPITYWNPWALRVLKVRPHEIGTRTSSLDFLIGFSLVWSLSPSWLTATACFVTAWADPLARVFGKRWGKTKWPRSNKTLVGSTACLITAALITLISVSLFRGYAHIVIAQALAVGLVTAAFELIPQFPQKPKVGDLLSPADNFWLITGSALTLMLVT
jgi:dolichol kinase